jgi:hypothetical protein
VIISACNTDTFLWCCVCFFILNESKTKKTCKNRKNNYNILTPR